MNVYLLSITHFNLELVVKKKEKEKDARGIWISEKQYSTG